MTADLSKLELYSGANSFKNNSRLYSGTINLPTSIPSGSFSQSLSSVTLDAPPQFSMFYAQFQEVFDAIEQYFGGPIYNGVQWYQASVNVRVGVTVTAPAPQAGIIEGLIYPVINGVNVSIIALINNPYATAITLAPQSIPWRFASYTMTN